MRAPIVAVAPRRVLSCRSRLLCLQHLVGGLGLQEGGAAGRGCRGEAILAQRVADGGQRRVGDRLQLATRDGIALFGRIRRGSAFGVRGWGDDRSVGEQLESVGGLDLLDGAT